MGLHNGWILLIMYIGLIKLTKKEEMPKNYADWQLEILERQAPDCLF